MKWMLLWSSDNLINKTANHKWAMYEQSGKARYLISSDCTGSREGVTSWSWENVLPICLLSLCILRHLLSLDSHGSAKCSSIQGSFHVPVTLLETLYSIAQQPFPLTLSGAAPYTVWLVYVCLCASLTEFVMSLCMHRCMSICCCTSPCHSQTWVRVCVCVCTYSCLYALFMCTRVCSAATTGMPAFSNLFVSACVNIYKCLQWAQPQREWSRANQFSAGCASLLPLSWAVIFKLFYNGSL